MTITGRWGTKAQPAAKSLEFFHSHVDASGRVLIHAPIRRRLGLKRGVPVSLRLDVETGTLTMTSDEVDRRAAQAAVSALHRPGESWSGELIADRHAEAARLYGAPKPLRSR